MYFSLVFPMYFVTGVFLSMMFVSCFAVVILLRLGIKNGPNWNPKLYSQGLPIPDVFLTQFGPFWRSFGLPKFAPKSPPAPWWFTWALSCCILAAQGSPHDKFCLHWIHLELSGGRFVLHFGFPHAHFDPLWHPFKPLTGSFGAPQGAFAWISWLFWKWDRWIRQSLRNTDTHTHTYTHTHTGTHTNTYSHTDSLSCLFFGNSESCVENHNLYAPEPLRSST